MTEQGTEVFIDCLQFSNPTRSRFEDLRTGRLTAINQTVAIWEDSRAAIANIGAWDRLFEQHNDLIVKARTVDDILAARATGRTAVVLGFQNGSPFEDDIDLVRTFHDLGVRIVQLTYNVQNHIGSGCFESRDSGISSLFGRSVINEMNEVGMLIDVSHCGERTTLEAIALSERPVAITHANPASFVGDQVDLAMRNKSDHVIDALAERGGVIGLSMYPRMAPDGRACTLSRFAEMVAWTVERVGVEHVGIGSDFCAGHSDETMLWWRTGRWSREPVVQLDPVSFPDWMPTPAQFPALQGGLAGVGFESEEISLIMGGNWLRVFAETFGGSAVHAGAPALAADV
jgi:microsomal dipeptidase-like Zn-dependent dipeptidase